MLLMFLGEDGAVWATTDLKEVELLARFHFVGPSGETSGMTVQN